MTPEDRELYAIRQIFLQANPRIAELPSDLQFRKYGSVTGSRVEEFSGTFNGRKLELEMRTYVVDLDKEEIKGKADGVDMSDDESREIYEDLHPIIKVYDQMQKTIEAAKKRLEVEKITKQETEESKIEEAEDLANKKGVEQGKIMGQLEGKLDGVEVDEKDTAFLEGVIEQIAKLETGEVGEFGLREGRRGPEGSIGVMRKLTKFGYPYKPAKRDYDYRNREIDKDKIEEYKREAEDYDRRKKLLFKILEVDEDANQKWISGFVNMTYNSNSVYATVFPDITLRECYDRDEIRIDDDRNGARIIIERNSSYQKKEQDEESESTSTE